METNTYQKEKCVKKFDIIVLQNDLYDYGCTPGGYQEMSSILAGNSALVYEPKCGGRGVAEPQPMSAAVHRSPNKLWKSISMLAYAVH